MLAILGWALPCMGATLIITCSTLTAPLRQFLRRRARSTLGEIIVCPMCSGFWVGVVAAVLGLPVPGLSGHHEVLVAFASGCSSAFVCWVSHVVLCSLGQGELLSTRRDLSRKE